MPRGTLRTSTGCDDLSQRLPLSGLCQRPIAEVASFEVGLKLVLVTLLAHGAPQSTVVKRYQPVPTEYRLRSPRPQ